MMEPDETMTVSRIEELKKAHKFPGVKPYTVDTDPSDQHLLHYLSGILISHYCQSYLFYEDIGSGCSKSKKNKQKFALKKSFHEINQEVDPEEEDQGKVIEDLVGLLEATEAKKIQTQRI